MANDLVARLGVDSSAWDSGFQKARGTVSSFGSGIGSLLSPATAAIAAGLAGAFGAGVSVAAFKESLDAQRKLSAVIDATGGSAGLTTKQITDFAAEMQTLTNFEDDATTAAAAMLVPFTNIRGQQFTDVIESAMDLSTVMGTDLNSSVMLLGKALNDPAEGFGKLAKAGIQFTDEQQNQIKLMQQSGDLLGAQEALLAGVQSKFGGAAEAVADPWKQLMNVVGDVSENIGAVLLPTINVISSAVSGLLGPIAGSGDSFKEFGIEAGVAVGQVVQWISIAADSLAQTLYPMIGYAIDGWNALLAAVGLGGGTFQEFITEAGATLENLGGYVNLAIEQWSLFFVQIGADASHLFTEVIPAYFNWFGDNWINILTDMVVNEVKAFKNIGTNIKGAWDSIIAYFQGKPLDFNWTPLTDGFVSTVDKLPDIGPRVAGNLEKGLMRSVEAATESLNESLQASRDKFAKSAAETRIKLTKQLNPESNIPAAPTEGAQNVHETKTKAKDTKVALQGSAEAAQLLLKGIGGKDPLVQLAQQQLKATEKTNELLAGEPVQQMYAGDITV